MIEREPQLTPDIRRQVIHAFVDVVFGAQRYHRSRDDDMNPVAWRRRDQISVGDLIREHGPSFQPSFSVQETITYPTRTRSRIAPRIQGIGRLLIPFNARIHSRTETAANEQRVITITYFARKVQTDQEPQYDGLMLTVLDDRFDHLHDPLLQCELLENDSGNHAQRLETYKAELAGLPHPTDQQLLGAIATLAAA